MTIDRTAEALQGFLAGEGEACPYATGTYFAAWWLGRILAELGREMPAFVRVLDAAHLEADGVAYQVQQHDEQGLVALIPVQSHVAPPAHLQGESECQLSALT